MDARTLALLRGQPLQEGPRYSGLPQPGSQFTDQTYSSGGLNRTLSSPYRQTGGVVLPTADGGANPGQIDPLLSAQLQMGDRGGYMRGATAFLGAGFNPWTRETGPAEGESVAPREQGAQIDALFDIAGQLGLDTSKYSRDAGTMGMRGERGQNDSMQLWDDLNELTKDYVTIDHMTDDGKSSERTLYLDQGGQLVPVSDPSRRSARQDSAFFGDDFKEMVMTIGPALLGGFMAPAAAGAGQAAGSAGGTAAATGATSQIPWGEIGSRALRGALTGGLTSGLQGGNILQGALMGGLSGGVSGAGVPAGVLNIGKRVLSGGLGMDSGSGGGGGSAPGAVGGGGGSVPGASVLGAALGGAGGSPAGGGGSQFYNPNDARARAAISAALLNRVGRAGDTEGDNPLTRALDEALTRA